MRVERVEIIGVRDASSWRFFSFTWRVRRGVYGDWGGGWVVGERVVRNVFKWVGE